MIFMFYETIFPMVHFTKIVSHNKNAMKISFYCFLFLIHQTAKDFAHALTA